MYEIRHNLIFYLDFLEKTFTFVGTTPCRKINFTLKIRVRDHFYMYLIPHWKMKMKSV